MKDFNWESLRFFLALVRCSTPSAAASLLHVDHNTVRRRVAILEQELDTKLLVKRDDEYCLTREGAVLMEAAEKIENLASFASKEIAGKDFEVSGGSKNEPNMVPKPASSGNLAPRASWGPLGLDS